MKIEEPISHGILIKRYNRFLADIKLDSGQNITAHCPNTGSMKQCKQPGSEVIVSISPNKKRKYPYTWQLVKINGFWCCINTILANKLTAEALKENLIDSLSGYSEIKPEQKYGNNSRIDFLLEDNGRFCYIEVKNVTLTDADKTAIFPDAVTARGQKHLKELINVVQNGHRGIMLYVIQRQETEFFDIAREIDPQYDKLVNEAIEAGVEILCWQSKTSESAEIYLNKEIPFRKR